DGGHHRVRQAAGRPELRAAARRAHHRPPGPDAAAAAGAGHAVRVGRPADGARPVLDPPGDAGTDRERAAQPAAAVTAHTVRSDPATIPVSPWIASTTRMVAKDADQFPVSSC